MAKQYVDPRKQVLLRIKPDHLSALDAKVKATIGADGKPMHRSDYLKNLILKDLQINENPQTSTDGFDDLFNQQPDGGIRAELAADIDAGTRGYVCSFGDDDDPLATFLVSENDRQHAADRSAENELAAKTPIERAIDDAITERSGDYWEQLADSFGTNTDH